MKKMFAAVAFTAIGIVCLQVGTLRADELIIDDYSGALTGYSTTVILDVNDGASNDSAFGIAGGVLQLNTGTYDDIEQLAFIKDGLTLNVGQEVRADFPDPLAGVRNLGLYVGGTAPATGVRQDFITIYGESTSSFIRSRGFDGTGEYDNPGSTVAGTLEYYFIARTDTNTYEAGYFDGARQIVTTRTPATANTGDFVGYYADVRGTGTLGSADNLRIFTAVPEPGSMFVLGLTGIALLVRRRK